ncbi:L3BPA protein, partial [Polyodon spathula]|nr:L3BPA protein [Polyodon spathula]
MRRLTPFIADGAGVRLANGSSCSGRVEVHHDGHWGSVCDDGWDSLDARVVCRELGCGDVVSAPGGAHFGRGVGPVWVYNATCTGSESSLTQCVNPGVGTSNCNHGEDAGVVCAGRAMQLLIGETIILPNYPLATYKCAASI